MSVDNIAILDKLVLRAWSACEVSAEGGGTPENIVRWFQTKNIDVARNGDQSPEMQAKIVSSRLLALRAQNQLPR